MAKKTYVSPSMMLLAADPGADLVPYSPNSKEAADELAKPGRFDEFGGVEDFEGYESPW
ncbi:hypothetical protein HMPREF1870_02012 [Bacteroidales bacterium KA00344]|nr:hypothetical protein HMPREF1870_02012 [Bacteroidales bacterium KA00344]